MKRSMAWNRVYANLTEKQDSGLSQMFGHLIVTYSPGGKGSIVLEPYTLVVGAKTQTMSGFTETATYRVVRRTEDMVVMKTTSGFMSGDVGTIHFDGPDTYWVHLDEVNPGTPAREYFRRIEGPNNAIQAAN